MFTALHAREAGQGPPENDTTRVQAGRIEEQLKADGAIVGNTDFERKRFATAQATAALRGMTLRRIAADDGRPLFIANFHALTRSFADLAEVEAWLERVNGTQPFRDPGRRERERERRAAIDAANRHQDQLDQAADFLRGSCP